MNAPREVKDQILSTDALVVAFVQGAQWWEYHQTQATMWNSDRNLAEAEALKRAQNGTLGVVRELEACHDSH